MNNLKHLLLVGIFVFTLGNVSIAHAADNSENLNTENLSSSVYQITPDSPAWENLSISERYEACRIEEDTLQNMTDEELIQAVINHPFLVDLFAYSSKETATTEFAKICDAYAELINRNTGKNSLMNFVEQRSSTASISNVSQDTSVDDMIINDALSILLLYQNDFSTQFTNEEIKKIASISTIIEYTSDSQAVTLSANSQPVTPLGNSVYYLIYDCYHNGQATSYHDALDQETMQSYTVTKVASGTCRYNCHSYAWHSSNPNNNIYWIPSPTTYLTDGSYTRIFSGTLGSLSSAMNSTDRLVYGTVTNATHSAIVVSNSTSEPVTARKVRSKWGSLGLFQHLSGNVPSGYGSNILVYR